MPRNGSGLYSLPAGNPVVTGTIISSTTHNNTMSDIASEMTNSVDKDGQTVLTGIIDHNGNNIVLDTDGDTLLDLGTDDQVGITIAGAEDFLFLANIFRALSGSVIETNTINETTAASGVTIDGVVLKDSGITAGGDILSDTDSTDSIGSNAVRWLKGWFDTLTAGTLTIGSGSITDSSGAITFGNENLSTTGTAATGALTVTGGITATSESTISAPLNVTIDTEGRLYVRDVRTLSTGVNISSVNSVNSLFRPLEINASEIRMEAPITVTGATTLSNRLNVTGAGGNGVPAIDIDVDSGITFVAQRDAGGTGTLDLGTNTEHNVDIIANGVTVATFAATTLSTSLAGTLGVSGDFTITDGTVNVSNSAAAETAFTGYMSHATYASSSVIVTKALRAASSAYSHFQGYSSVTSDLEFHLRGDGTGFCDGSWTGGGADYAEWFEWSDGNPTNEDRAGYAVTLDGNKIRLASEGDTLIGVVSVMPGVVGDGDIGRWKGKYQKDDFGRYIFEEYSQVEWVEILEPAVEGVEHVEAVEYQAATDATYDDESVLLTEETPEVLAVAGVEGIAAKDAVTKDHSYQYDAIPEGLTAPKDAVVTSEDENGVKLERRKLSVDYVEAPYISREDRQEWSTVGLMGKLRIRKGQPVATSWIKMREISASVDEWLVK